MLISILDGFVKPLYASWRFVAWSHKARRNHSRDPALQNPEVFQLPSLCPLWAPVINELHDEIEVADEKAVVPNRLDAFDMALVVDLESRNFQVLQPHVHRCRMLPAE